MADFPRAVITALFPRSFCIKFPGILVGFSEFLGQELTFFAVANKVSMKQILMYIYFMKQIYTRKDRKRCATICDYRNQVIISPDE